jgi:multiple sugar transport system ATP-binding protein
VAAFLGAPAMNLIPAKVSGHQLTMPLGMVALDETLRNRIGDRSTVIVGVRPELCHDATTPEGRDVTDRVEFTTRIDDVEWRGKTQLVYLGYELETEVEEMLSDIEDTLDFDLFGNFIVAELPASSELRAGMSARIVVPRDAIHVFDTQTGENLIHG